MSNTRWSPQSGKRDPRQPFGQQSATSPTSVPAWTPPPRKPVWPLVVGVVVAIAVIVAAVALWPSSQLKDLPDQPVMSAYPSSPVTGNAIPYEGNGTGIVEVNKHEWIADGLQVTFTIKADDSTYYFQVFAFANETRLSYEPRDTSLIMAEGGKPVTAVRVFDIPRGDTTFVVASSGGRALTALPIPG